MEKDKNIGLFFACTVGVMALFFVLTDFKVERDRQYLRERLDVIQENISISHVLIEDRLKTLGED